MNKKLKSLLVCATILGSVPFANEHALAVDNFTDLKSAIDASATPTIDVTGDITFSGMIKPTGKTVTINGNDNTFNGAGVLGFDVQDDSTTLNISNVTMKDFSTNSWGSVIYNIGNLNLENVVFDGNKNTNGKVNGAVVNNTEKGYVGNANLLGKMIFTNNTASTNGGAINNAGVMLVDSQEQVAEFKKNSSKNGGAIYNFKEGDLTFDGKNVVFGGNTKDEDGNFIDGNSASYYGGAIYNDGTITTKGGMTFQNNHANERGGAIFNYGELNFDSQDKDVTFTGNNTKFGGAIYNDGKLNFKSDVLFGGDNVSDGNSSTSNGGAIYNTGKMVVDSALTFKNNSSTYYGGAIFNKGDIIFNSATGKTVSFISNTINNGRGGAIYNEGSIFFDGNYLFQGNTAGWGGAITNSGLMNIVGNYVFDGNKATARGGAINNERGNLTINGTNENGNYSINFVNNSVGTSGDAYGGAIYIAGTAQNPAFLNITGANFTNNVSTTHGGAIHADANVSFNIEDSLFQGNIADKDSTTYGWGGALGLYSDDLNATINPNVRGYVKNTVFKDNYAGDAGGAIPVGTTLTVVNSTFMGNHAGDAGGAISYNPKNYLLDRELKIVADGGDTIFSGNWVGAYDSERTAENSEGLYIGNAVFSDSWADENDSNVYLNAGNQGKIIFNDIVNASGQSKDDRYEKYSKHNRPDVNNPNIQLNKNVPYSKFEPAGVSSDVTAAPTDGTIIFNNKIRFANLVLHNGVLTFGQANNIDGYIAPSDDFQYFSEGGKITLKGGTLDLINQNIESKEKGTFNPDKLTVLGNANLRLDLDLGQEKIDFINSEIVGEADNQAVLTIDKISFTEGVVSEDDLGKEKLFQFVKKNSLAENNTVLAENLHTIITSNAGYTLGLAQSEGGTTNDSISVKQVLSAGGLPVAVSLGDDDELLGSSRTYIYNATQNEEITAKGGANAWNKSYSIWVDDATKPEGGYVVPKHASNQLKGKLLQINGNSKNVFTSDKIIGIEVGTVTKNNVPEAQQLIINDVKQADNTGGWEGFNSALINKGGIITLNNSIFSKNKSSDYEEDGVFIKAGNGGAVYNQSGTLNINNTNFLNNSATKDGGAIYNEGEVNITATNANNVTFSGNTASDLANDIYNAGTLNLSADEKSSIVFNGGISGGSTKGLINIGSDQYLGNVIFNNTVANQTITLNNGSLQLGANAQAGRSDYFQNVDLTLNGGTFNTSNNFIDTISVDKLTIRSSNPQWTLDVDLSNGGSADNILANSVVQDSGNLKIGHLNIINALAEGQDAKIKIIDKVVSTDVTYKNVITSGYSYFIGTMDDGTNTYLTISQNGESGGFTYEVIKDSNVPTSYTIDNADEIVNSWIGGNNKLGGVNFEINGGDLGSALVGKNGIAGIVVGVKNGNPQQLRITGVNSYKGFDSAVINNGGKVVVSSSEKFATNFTENNATGNGGVIQNNIGTVNIEAGTTFTNNQSVGKGGAIFNDAGAILNFITDETTDKISFGGNSATGGGNDIYNDGMMNVSGNGLLTIGSGIAGSGNIYSDGNISLSGDNSGFTGLFEQKLNEESSEDADPTITVEANSTFFGGTSNIQKGSLVWNTANDLVGDAKLTVNGASLTVGENAQLTIKGESSIDGATSVTTNGTLNLAKDMTVGKINGNGTLSATDSTLTFNNGSSLSNDLSFSSSNATANILANADNVLSAITKTTSTNDNLKINLNGTNSSTDIKVDGTNISELNFSNNVEYSGSITGNGNVTNSGNLTIKADQRGFGGTFTQTAGSTTVDKSENLFGGIKNIESGKLTINAGKIEYKDINLGTGAEFTQNITDSEGVSNLDSGVLKFADANVSNAKANFVNGNINLSKIDNGNTNTISFDGSKVSLAETNYQGGTIYNFKDAELDLRNSNGDTNDYVFDNINTNNTDLNFNINVVKKGAEEVGARGLETDTVTVNGGNAQFNIGKLHISGEENGYRGDSYTTDKNVLNGATFNPDQNDIEVATTTWRYIVTQNTANNSIQMTIYDYANTDTLNAMNKKSGTRFFQFSDGDNREYHIKESLGPTGNGNFTVSSTNEGGNVLSGLLDGKTDERGSFFNIAENVDTKLTIDNVTIQDAYKDGNGSVVSNESKISITTISNSIIQNNSSTSNGGALYNGAKPNDDNFNMIVSNTRFTNNATDGKGGAIYNAGNLKLEGITLDAGNDTAKNDIYQTTDGNTTLAGTNNINSGFAGSGKISNIGNLILTGDNSQYIGEFEQSESTANTLVKGDNVNFFGGTSTISDGNLFWHTKNSDLGTGKLTVNGGSLNIGDTDIEAKLTLGDGSSIANDAKVTIFGNSELELTGGSTTNLNGNDYWLGKITLNGGELNLNNIYNYTGSKLEANSGNLNINDGKLIVANGSEIKQDVDTNITAGSTLQIDETSKVSMSGNNSTWDGQVTLNGGDLTLNDFTTNGKIIGAKGNLILETGSLTVGTDSIIANEVNTEINIDTTLDITDNGVVNLDKDDIWAGTVSLNGGTLNYSNENTNPSAPQNRNGTFIGESGNLNILEGTVMEIITGSKIEEAVKTNLSKNSELIIIGGDVKLDKEDIWNGRISVISNGTLSTNGVEHSDTNGGTLQIGSPGNNDANVTFDNNSKIYLTNENSSINGGSLSIKNGSMLYLGGYVADMTLNNFTMSNNSQLNSINGAIDESIIDSMNVNGLNHVAIDIAPRAKVGDTFIIDNLNGSGTLNINDFNFVGPAPIDRRIKLQVFDAQNINDVEFTATDKKIFTPIGNYKLVSEGAGVYSAVLSGYNPQVFRGQVATLAAYNHQLLIDDMVTNHFILPNERQIDKAAQANKTASISPLFAPYQSTIEEGGLWTKTYVSFENLSMTNNLKVGNNVYGTLIGADFPMIKLKNGWKFIPTAYVGYNGGNQNFNGVDIIQNGGQGGFMGTFIKNNFIGSITAYGGGYFNEMNVAGNTDKTGNWFVGTATKLAYNIHATNHFIIQPTAFVSYNIFGKQSWGTDFGTMSMNSGTLNGVNVAPGLNLIYSRDTWSVYGTIQYMFNINDQVGGKAGNVKLPTTEMRHGYINYGVGFTKTWKERLNSYFQINFRNGGRTGVGFQLGLNYFFDWGKPKKKSMQTPTAKPVKKVIKSI